MGMVACLSRAVAGPYENTITASNPLAFYQLTETTGTVVINSVNPGTNDLTYYDIALQQPPTSFLGATNPSVSTNGSASSGIQGTVSSLNDTSFSLEFLVQDLTDNSTYNFLFSKGSDANTSFNIGVDLGGGGVAPAGNLFIGNNNQYFDAGVALGNGWRQIAFTYNAATSEQRLYLNGNFVFGTTQSVSASGLLTFGQRMDGGGPALSSFSDISVYSTVLDATTIQSHYDALVVPEPSAGLLLGFTGLAFVIYRRRLALRAAN